MGGRVWDETPLDFFPTDYILISPCPTEGALEGARNAGTAAAAGAEMRQRRLRDQAGEARGGRCGARRSLTQGEGGGPSHVVPMCRLHITGRGDRQGSVPHASLSVSPQAVGRCWTSRNGKRGRRLKSQPTGGHAEQAYKRRARDAGGTADLRL